MTAQSTPVVSNTIALLLGKQWRGASFMDKIAREIICDRVMRILARHPNAAACAVDPDWVHARMLEHGGYQGLNALLMVAAVQLLVQHCQVRTNRGLTAEMVSDDGGETWRDAPALYDTRPLVADPRIDLGPVVS